MKILMVCLGNICRSPLAEGIMKAQVKRHGLNWQVDSAGTSGFHSGSEPDSRSIKVAKKYGIDITDQRSRKFHYSDFENFDAILVMDSANYNDVMQIAEHDAERDRVSLIMNWAEPKRNMAVPDPYYGGDEGFDNVYKMLEKACEGFIQSMLTK